MKLSSYYYDLPHELIAQTPLEKRDESRLLVVDKESGETSHRCFYDICDYLNEGDCLVINDTRVIPARIFGKREGKDSVIETVLLKRTDDPSCVVWECLTRPGKKTRKGEKIIYSADLAGIVEDIIDDGIRKIRFEFSGAQCDETFFGILSKIGLTPLPPYITEKLEDGERYQTVYSLHKGSAAAPTAGLHFTSELLEKLKSKGVNIARVLLHVGLGTFRPVKEENILDHKMHTEYINISSETASLLNTAKKNNKRIIAVGTTSCRVLESVTDECGTISAFEGETGIFIYPGYKFKAIDGLITNFHLPESTLLMLVSAFGGYEHIMNAYKEAIKERYRFFSFGDAMLIK